MSSNPSLKQLNLESSTKKIGVIPTTRKTVTPVIPPSPKGPHVSEGPFWRLVIASVGIGVFLIVWDAYAVWINNQVAIATPVSVAGSLSAMLLNQFPKAVIGENLYLDLLATLQLITIGYLISLVGIPIGFLMGRWRAAEAIVDPWINALYAIPMVAFAPIIYVTVGGSLLGGLLIVFLMTFFTITINTFHGVRYVSNSYAEVGRSFGANEGQFFRHVLLPASLPDIVAGMRLGLGRAVLGTIVAEVLLTHDGLGNLMFVFQELSRTPEMMGVIVLIAIIGVLVLNAPKLLERKLFAWKESERLSRNL